MPAEALGDEHTLEETVEFIRATPANPTQIRPATMNLADVLPAAPSDPTFDLESWQRQWSEVEAERKGLTRANDVAEGRTP
jgi:hypothetical protein